MIAALLALRPEGERWAVLAQIVLAGAQVIDDLREVDVSVLDGRP